MGAALNVSQKLCRPLEHLPALCHGCFPVIRQAGCAAEISTQTSQLLLGDITADLPALFKSNLHTHTRHTRKAQTLALDVFY